MQRIRQWAVDPFPLRVVTILLFFLLMFPALKSTMDGLVKVVLLWGAWLIVWDVCTRRDFVRMDGAPCLLLFLAMGAVTLVLNRDVGLRDNASLLCYCAVAMLVLYPHHQKTEGETAREWRVLGLLYVSLCGVASLISLLTMILGISGTLEYGGTLYHTGVVDGRLWGIYSNPNFPAAMLAVAVAVMLFPLCRRLSRTVVLRRVQYVVLGTSLAFNLWYVLLAQSRASMISLVVFGAVYAFFWIGKGLLARLHRRVLAWILSAAAVAIASVAVLASVPWVVETSSWFVIERTTTANEPSGRIHADRLNTVYQPPVVLLSANSGGTASLPAPHTALFRRVAAQEVIGRDPLPEHVDMLTGRPELWRAGWEKFCQRPWFGYGYVGGKQGVYHLEEPINHFHNVLIQSLVTAGLAGTLPLLAFAAVVAVRLIRYGWRRRRAAFKELSLYYAGVAFIALYAVHNMVEVFLVYSVSLPNFLFWIWLGQYLTMLAPYSHKQGPTDDAPSIA